MACLLSLPWSRPTALMLCGTMFIAWTGCQVDIPSKARSPASNLGLDGSVLTDGEIKPDVWVSDGPVPTEQDADVVVNLDSEMTPPDDDGSSDADTANTDVSDMHFDGSFPIDGAAQDSSSPDAAGNAFFHEDWRWRVKLRIEEEVRAQVLHIPLFVNLPVDLLNINENSVRRELRFVDAQGRVLPHNIESIRNGAAHLWVRLASLPAGGESFIWVYWDNPMAPPPQNDRFVSDMDLAFFHFGNVGMDGSIENEARPEHLGVFDGDRCEVRMTGNAHLYCRGRQGSLAVPSLSGDAFPAQGFTLSMTYEVSEVAGDGYLLADGSKEHEQYMMRVSPLDRDVVEVVGNRSRGDDFGPARVTQFLDQRINHLMLIASPGNAQVLMNGNVMTGLDTLSELALGMGGGFVPSGQNVVFLSGKRAKLYHVHLLHGVQSIEWARIYQLASMGSLFVLGEPEGRPEP